jgi:uncharacterized protein (AIM24 family)
MSQADNLAALGSNVNSSGVLQPASGGTGSTSTTFVNAATNITGTLPVANGGTGASTLTANNVILGNGTSAVAFVAPSTNGNVLTSNGTTWTSSAPAAAGFICRAWVNFNGTGTVAINGSGNVSSITDAGTGNYTVNMTTAISDTNYAVTLAARLNFSGSFTQGYANLGGNSGTYSTTAFNISTLRTDNDQFIDSVIVGAAVFR